MTQTTRAKNGRHPIRLSWGMIVRDCADTLEPLLASLRPHVNEIVIGFGGNSSDKTEQVARKYADVTLSVGEFFGARIDFAAARNEVMKHATGEYFGWCDGDDSLDYPERIGAILDAMDKGQIDRVDMTYEYAHDEHGNMLTEHQRERIVRMSKNWHWLDRIHETLNTDEPHKAAYDDTIRVIHKRQQGNSAERNLPILLEMMDEDPKPRTLIHIAHSCYSLGRFEEAQFYYEQYLNAPENDINQWSAAIMGARAALKMENWTKAASWGMLAAGICPQYQDAYAVLAQASWHGDRDVEKAQAWVATALNSKQAPLAVFRTPLDNQRAIWDVQHRIYGEQKQWAQALEVCELWHAAVPDDEQITALIQFYRECVLTEKSRHSALQLADHLVRHGDVVRAKGLLENFLPSVIRDDPAVLAAQMRVREFLDTEGNQGAYEDADCFTDDYDIEEFPRYQWYVDRLKAIGAKKILEVGCHNGLISRSLAKLGFECVGVDFNEGMVKLAQERSDGNCRFIAGRLEDITEKFDAVIFAEILEHVTPSTQIAMLNYAETLAPTIMGSVPAEPIGLCAGLWEKSDIGASAYRPHIFEFDQSDIETLIMTDPERRIVNAHRLVHADHPIPGYGNRVFEFTRAPLEKQGIGISFVLGPGFEHWTPTDIEAKGIGGSETAAVRLSEELASRGHYVTVYGPEEGVYNGVVYRHWRKFDPTVAREVVIVSRELAPLEERPNAAIVMLWCHDMAYEEGDFTPELASRVDKIVLMSEWQKGYWSERYPWLPAEKMVVAGNAIKRYDVAGVERIRGRFIYSSSPDRGLDDLLIRWPLICEVFPDGDGGSLAELHIFYGWQYLNAAPHLASFKRQIIELMKQPGVFWHGRLGQKQLAEEFAKAQFWLYPSMLPRQPNQIGNGADFHETFCITAVEAQAYGCIPITRAVGALSERIHNPQCIVELWTTGSILTQLSAWDSTDAQASIEMHRENAEQYTWKSVADTWLGAIAGMLIMEVEDAISR